MNTPNTHAHQQAHRTDSAAMASSESGGPPAGHSDAPTAYSNGHGIGNGGGSAEVTGNGNGTHRNTTTISTIVLNSKPIQLVIALLRSGDVYHIKVVDIAPKLTFLGANIDEAVHLQREHDVVFKQLQLQSSPIEEFAPKATALLRDETSHPQVLAAMGESLQLAWADVLDLLKRRKHILDSNANLHEKIAVCTGKMSALEVACRDTMIPIEIDSVQEFLNKFKQLRIEVLAAVMVALKEGNELLSCLRALANAGTLDTRPDHIRVEVKRSLTQVEVWLEQLHDRRNVLEIAWQTRKVQLEQCLALAIFAKELHDLETLLQARRQAVHSSIPNLGDSEMQAQQLHADFMQHKQEALSLRDKALKITRATEKLVSSGCFAGDEASARAYSVLSSCTEYLDFCDRTEQALGQTREFFNRGERALGILERLEIEVSSARNATCSADVLAIHMQVLQEIGEITGEALRLGYTIINDVGRSNANMSGIERVIEDIENRKVYLEDLCSASSEKCMRIEETLTTFMERHNHILSWLLSSAETFLRENNDVGDGVTKSEGFLKAHHQLMSDLEIKGTEINALLVSVNEILGDVDAEKRRDIDKKIEALHSHWTQLKNLAEGRVDLVTIFVQFLQLAESLSNMFDYIENMLRESPEEDRLAQLDDVWAKVKPAYEQLKSEGARFMDATFKVSDPYLETASARKRVNEILTGFSGRQIDITESWENWTHRIVERRETERLVEQTMTENVQSMNTASKLDAQLYPVITAPAGVDLNELRRFLVDKQTSVLDEIDRAQLEISQRIESTRSLQPSDDVTRGKINIVLDNLNAIHTKLHSISSGYRSLLDSFVDFVQRVGETRTDIERYFREQFASVNADRVDELARSHAQFRDGIMARFRALIAQSEQIIERVRQQEPEQVRDHDTDRILALLERLRADFETQDGAKSKELKLQQDVGKFTRELSELHVNLDDVSRQLAETLKQPNESASNADAVRVVFEYFVQTIELMETRVITFTSSAQQTLGSAHPDAQADLHKLNSRWSDIKQQVQAAGKTIDLTADYHKLNDKIDQDYRNALSHLASITADIPNVKTPVAAAAFNAAIDDFIVQNEPTQMNQLKQLAQLSHEIYGFDKTVSTFNEHIALYQSFGKLKADIAAIAEQIRLEEEHRQQQAKLQDQLAEQQKQQTLLQQQQQHLLDEKMRLQQQLKQQQEQQQQQQQQLALELQQQREQQEQLLHLQNQQQLQQRQQLEQQLHEQQQHQRQLQAEQQLLQQQLKQQKALSLEVSAQKAAAVDVTDRATSTDSNANIVQAQVTTASTQVGERPADVIDKSTSTSNVLQQETVVSHQTTTTSSFCTRRSEPRDELIFVRPLFEQPLADATVQEGDRITLECIVVGVPPPSVEWYKDGLNIHGNTDYKPTFDGRRCALTIDESIVADSARFTCTATNAAGQAETTCVLLVSDPTPLVILESPQFTRPLHNGQAREGEAFEFRCTVTGNPLPTVQWYKNDVCIDHLKDFHITFNNGDALLRLEHVFLEDQAEFVCRATNPYGTEQSSAFLTVEPLEPTEKPRFVVPLSNCMARVGQKIKLECTVAGIPTPDLFWTHNGKPFVDRDSKLQYEQDRATLQIVEAFPKDAGVYVLTARNLAGEAHCTCNVTVKGRLPNETSDSEIPSDMEPIKPTVQLPLKNTSVFEGQSVRLDCVIVGQPEPEVIWYHNDRPVKESADVQLLFQGDRCTLVVQEAFLEDAGKYRVVALNSAGEASSSCELSVTPLNELDPARRSQVDRTAPVGQPPSFERLLSDILTDEGEQIEFECTLLGDPRPTVKWLLNNREIAQQPDDERIAFVYSDEGTAKLIIRNVRQSDKGVYTVRATNSCGDAKCFSHLIVKSVNTAAGVEIGPREPTTSDSVCPSFKLLFTDQSARIDEPVRFECIVVGRPTPKIRWLFNDQPVHGQNFLQSRSGDRQVLAVPAVTSATVGRIACVAENEAGRASCQAALTLLASASAAPLQTDSQSAERNFVEEYNTGSSNVVIQKKLYTSTHTSQVNTTENASSLPQTQIHGYADRASEQSNQTQEYRQSNDGQSTTHTRSIVNFTKATPSPSSESSAAAPAVTISQRKQHAPRFVTPFNGKIVDQGGSVQLEAIVDGYPSPDITITKNGQPLFESPNVTIANKCNKISVELRDVSVADAGRYSVLASNVAGTSNCTADVVVKKSIFPPVFGHRLQAQVVKRNERVRMDVEVSGTPPPTVQWFKNGKPIQEAMSSEFEIKQSGNNHTLIIGSVQVADSGKYMVKANNAAGEAQSIADFAVLEPTPDRMVEVVKTVVYDHVPNQKASENQSSSSAISSHDQTQFATVSEDKHHGMIEETVVTETRRTTEATMRMEHKPQLDIPITHSHYTQTAAVAVSSASTSMPDQVLKSSATNTDRPPVTTSDATQTPHTNGTSTDIRPQTEAISKRASLEYFSKIISKESSSNTSNLSTYTKFENESQAPTAIAPIQPAKSIDQTAKLHAELAEMNLVPGPPPEIVYAPKPTQEPVKRTNLADRIRMLDESNHTISDVPSGGVRMLPAKITESPAQLSNGGSFALGFSSAPAVPAVPAAPATPAASAAPAAPVVSAAHALPAAQTAQASQAAPVAPAAPAAHAAQAAPAAPTASVFPAYADTLAATAAPADLAPPAQAVLETKTEQHSFRSTEHFESVKTAHNVAHIPIQAPKPAERAHSPRPSAEGVAMDRLWTTIKPGEHTKSVQHNVQSSIRTEKSSEQSINGVKTFSHSESDTEHSRYASDTPDGNSSQRPTLQRRNSTKETAKMFENKIRDMDSAPAGRHAYDLKAPGLVKQILPRATPPHCERPRSVHMESPLPAHIQLEPGSPPEICYAPRVPTASERKQSLVEAIEQTIEKDFAKGPTKILAGAVRMIPPAKRQTSLDSAKPQSNGVKPATVQPSNNISRRQSSYESKTFESLSSSKQFSGQMNGNGHQSSITNGTVQQPTATVPNPKNGVGSSMTDSNISQTTKFESYSSNFQKSSYSSNSYENQNQPADQSTSMAQPASHVPHKSFSHDHHTTINHKQHNGSTHDLMNKEIVTKNIAINARDFQDIVSPPAVKTPLGQTFVPSPAKFVKSDYKESDYESDFDHKIIAPVWRPPTATLDSDSEPLVYKPIRPVLSTPSSRPTSQLSDGYSPMPPTVFDQPPKFDGPPRPKFQPIEKPKQTSPYPQYTKATAAPQKLFKPTPVTPQRPQPNRPVQPPQPAPAQQTQFYTAISGPPQHIASETRNQMHMRESTETSQRIVNMTQTKRVIQFSDTQSLSKQSQHIEHHQPYTVTEPPAPLVRGQRTATVATPTKFVPSDSRDSSHYESDVDSARIRPLWTPIAGSDEPQYRRVQAPALHRSNSLPRSTGAPVPTPMEFDNKPVELPSKIDTSDLLTKDDHHQQQQIQKTSQKVKRANSVQGKTQTLNRYSSMSTTSTTSTSSKQKESRQSTSRPVFELKPASPPQYGFIGALEQQSPVGAMKESLSRRAHDFMGNVAQDVQRTTPSKQGDGIQAYRDESRVSQYENWSNSAESQRATPICTPNIIQEAVAKRPPMFITPLKDIAVINGSMARFECIVQCDPYPNIAWWKNGVQIANDGGRFSIVFRNGVCRLTIPQAFTADSGTYSCTATNHLGTAQTNATCVVPNDSWTTQRK